MIRVIDATEDVTPVQIVRRRYLSMAENHFRQSREELEKQQQLSELQKAVTSYLLLILFVIACVFIIYILTK